MIHCETNFLIFKDFSDYNIISNSDFFYFDIINVTIDSNTYYTDATIIKINLFTHVVPAQIRVINSTITNNDFINGGYIIVTE